MSLIRLVRFTVAVCLLPAAGSSLGSEIERRNGAWELKSAGVIYRLRVQDNSLWLDYFGPESGPGWKTPKDAPAADIAGRAEGQGLSPAELLLVGHDVRPGASGSQTGRFLLRHRRLPLEIEAVYGVWGDTGVFTRRLTVTNRGDKALRLESLPALALMLPPGEYELSYLWGGWGQERQLATERLGPGRREFISNRGRSTSMFSPWFGLRNATLGVTFVAQLAWSGNWQMSFERLPAGWPGRLISDKPLEAKLGMEFDFGGSLSLPPGVSRELPEVAFTASAGDLDNAANQLHRYQRNHVIPRTPSNDPLLVQFNSWYPYPGKLAVAELKRCADVAGELGAEVFVLDSGWYNKVDWSKELGDYEADRTAFPNGIEELSGHVRGKGMKFGIWVEIENVGVESRMFREHPDWCFQYNGKPVVKGVRCMLNFAKPEVRKWAHAVIDRLVRDYRLGWIKIDYNIDIGEEFDPPDDDRPGDALYNHIRHYYQWLDEVRAAYPDLVIENCSSGGLRFDLGILRHTHTTWLSDEVKPVESVQLGYGCTVEFAPEVCNHWMVGEAHDGRVKLDSPPGWWDFLFRVPMNGQYGLSSRVYEWNDALKQRARENVELYKRIRRTIMGADVYHLTPPPDNSRPTGWMGLQYVSSDNARSVLMAYRLGQSNMQHVFRLRGLAKGKTYRVRVDGRPQGAFTAEHLAGAGLPVTLDAEWRAAVIELE